MEKVRAAKRRRIGEEIDQPNKAASEEVASPNSDPEQNSEIEPQCEESSESDAEGLVVGSEDDLSAFLRENEIGLESSEEDDDLGYVKWCKLCGPYIHTRTSVLCDYH
jgi:hypothetical protein